MKPTVKLGILLAGAGCTVLCSFSVFLLTQPKAQAKAVLKRFYKECRAADTAGMMRDSLLDELYPCWESFSDDSYSGEPITEDALRHFAEDIRGHRHLEITGCENAAADYEKSAAAARLNQEREKVYAEKLAEKGFEIELDPEGTEQFIAYLDQVKDAYRFQIRWKENGKWIGQENEETAAVVMYGGVWLVDPYTQNVLLPVIRDPDEIENETEP
ncbi:MAG TPA: hypothetical protein DDX71_01870 [Ruminococcus sp.]|nr:hypothetical protein [Ruminococcus sp.]